MPVNCSGEIQWEDFCLGCEALIRVRYDDGEGVCGEHVCVEMMSDERMDGWITVNKHVLLFSVHSSFKSAFKCARHAHFSTVCCNVCVCGGVCVCDPTETHSGEMLAWLCCIKVNSDISVWPPD